MTRNIGRKSIDLSNINRRRFTQGVSSIVGVNGLGVSGPGKASAEDTREYIGASYDTRAHITQRKCTASLNYKPDDRLSGILEIAGYNIPVGSDGRIKPNSSSDMRSYRIEKEEEKFQEDDQELQIRLNFDRDRIVGWVTRPTPKFAKLSFSMNTMNRGATMDKIENALNLRNFSKSDKNPTIPQKGVPTETSIQNMRVKSGKLENYLKKRGDE